MQFWTEIIDFVNYNEGYREIRNYPETAFLTRNEWQGIHFTNRYGEYCILLSNGHIVINPIEVFEMDKPDWVLVEVNEAALELIKDSL